MGETGKQNCQGPPRANPEGVKACLIDNIIIVSSCTKPGQGARRLLSVLWRALPNGRCSALSRYTGVALTRGHFGDSSVNSASGASEFQ